VAWRIIEGPGDGPWEGKDAVGWLWAIEDDAHQQRRILVEVSGTAMAVDEDGLPDDVRNARRTLGRSAVEAVIALDDPPRRISFKRMASHPPRRDSRGTVT
jgi:hypothetical protein